MKKQLVIGSISVLGLTLFSFSLFKLDVNLHFGGSSQSNPTAATASDTRPNPNQQNQKEIQPRPNAERAKLPQQSTVARPQVRPSVRQVGQDAWRVMVSGDQWFDTGIPVVADWRLYIELLDGQFATHKWLTKIGGKVFFPINGWGGVGGDFYIEEHNKYNRAALIVDYDFQDTLKFKLDGEGQASLVELSVRVNKLNSCLLRKDEQHAALHSPHFEWAERMKEKLMRE